MSKTEKSYCSLYTFVKKTNPELYDILDDMCAVGLFRTRHDITFLNPNDKLTDKLVKMVESGNTEQAFKHLKSLFIYGKHEKLNKDVVSYNEKNYSDDLSGLKLLSEFKQWEDNKNVSVFDYESNDFPKEGEKASRPPIKREKKGKKGGSETNTKVEFTNELMNNKNHQQVEYTLNSLLKYIKEKDITMFNKIKYKIDPNMILSWYIIAQPNKSNPDYVKHELFNEWKAKNAGNIPEDVEFIKHIFNNIDPCREILLKNKNKRAEVNSHDEDFKKFIDKIKDAYNEDSISLLEDELRFRYSNEEPSEMFAHYIPTLNGINWDNPNDSLILVNKCGINLLQNPVFECVKEFVNSNSFKYTFLNDSICNQLTNSNLNSKRGSGIKGEKKIVKILGNKHREILKNTKSINTVEIVESLLNHLSKKEKDHLKSLL